MKFKEQNDVIIVKNLLWMSVSNMSITLLSTRNVVIWLPMDPGIVLIAPIYSYSSQLPHIVHVLPTSCQREFECMNLRPCRNLQSINTITSFVPLVGPPRTIMLGCNWLVAWVGVMELKKVVIVLCWWACVAVLLSFEQAKAQAPWVCIFHYLE